MTKTTPCKVAGYNALSHAAMTFDMPDKSAAWIDHWRRGKNTLACPVSFFHDIASGLNANFSDVCGPVFD
jgi:hypothetical protein